MIEFINVYKSYDKPVLENISFRINNGENLGVFGESGIGKSTIVDLILGLEYPNQGQIINDYKKPAVVFQENRLIEEISALNNLMMITSDKNFAKDALNLFQIRDLDKKVRDFSGGMKRRVALARAYVYGGDILILDEPFAGLDIENKENAISLLKERFDKKSILLVSHNKADFPYFGIDEANLICL